MFEISLDLAERGVHIEKRSGGSGQWKINGKAERRAEVSFQKLSAEDQQDFFKPLSGELGLYLEKEAVEIATRNGVPSERVLPMRWVLMWKPVKHEHGQVTGRKPKARLIFKGLLDPDLLHLMRESLTLSTQNRNLLLSVAAQRRWQAQIGDIKTAFLNGNDIERARNQGAGPPPEVRAMLNMKPWETVRVLRAVYGLLRAP